MKQWQSALCHCVLKQPQIKPLWFTPKHILTDFSSVNTFRGTWKKHFAGRFDYSVNITIGRLPDILKITDWLTDAKESCIETPIKSNPQKTCEPSPVVMQGNTCRLYICVKN